MNLDGKDTHHRKTYCHVINVNEVDEHDEKKNIVNHPIIVTD